MRFAKTRNECFQWIQEQFVKAPLGRLPSIRQMAISKGVSTRTIQLVVQQMKAQGFITSKPGGGLYLTHAMALQGIKQKEITRKWEYWAKSLQEEIRNGFYSQRIPSQKELQVKWNVSAPLVRKVLRYLEQIDVVEQLGARYCVKTARIVHKIDRMVLVVAAMQNGKIRMDTHREMEFFRCIEEECLSMGYTPRIVGYEEATGKWSDANVTHSPQVVGVIFSPWHLLQGQKCMRKILTWGYPVSVWLESPENEEFIKRSHRQHNTAYFSVGYGERPGRDVGKYLLAQGLRSALFISPFHGSQWSKVLSELPLPKAMQKSSHAKLQRHLLQWREKNMHLVRDHAILQVLEPLLLKAMTFPHIEAWVFANDIVASLCKEWLQEDLKFTNKKWLSFDNSPEVFLQGINSYDFNTRGMVQSMLLHLRNPQSPIYSSHEVIYPRGRVIERSVS